MSYYFESIHKSDYDRYSKATQLKHIKRRAFGYLSNIARLVELESGIRTFPYWVSMSTFGAVLCDYEPGRKGPAIIGNHKALYDLISDQFDFLVLSENLDRNLQVLEINDRKVLVINILRYKNFRDVFGDKFKKIKLFLFQKLTKEEEDIINNWIESKPSDIKKGIPSSEDAIKSLSNNNPEKISEAINRLEFIKENKIISQVEYYEKELNEFEQMVKSDKLSETQLRDELFKRLWIIDFKYTANQFDKVKEYNTDVGNVDLWISSNKLGKIRNVLIELKLPDKLTIKRYRNKEAIRAEIGSALSQLVHYLESTKKPYQIQNGLLIIGREPEESFIEIFNFYLHGIKIKTYQQIIDDCRQIILSFKLPIQNTETLDDKQ